MRRRPCGTCLHYVQFCQVAARQVGMPRSRTNERPRRQCARPALTHFACGPYTALRCTPTDDEPYGQCRRAAHPRRSPCDTCGRDTTPCLSPSGRTVAVRHLAMSEIKGSSHTGYKWSDCRTARVGRLRWSTTCRKPVATGVEAGAGGWWIGPTCAFATMTLAITLLACAAKWNTPTYRACCRCLWGFLTRLARLVAGARGPTGLD